MNRSDKGHGRIYETPLTRKEMNIRYVQKYWTSGRELPHGKVWCYSKLGCRCDECRKAVREYQRKYEKAKRELVR